MKKSIFLIIVCGCLCVVGKTYAQENNADRQKTSQGISEEQKAAVFQIVKQYDFSSLTADEAKTIHQSIREIGIHGGPQEDDLIRSAGADPEILKKLDPPPDKRQDAVRKEEKKDFKSFKSANKYNLEQAISDNAQLTTIAFSGLAFLTGDFGAATFIPPGKVCDFFGFQYMRDIDAAQKGHNPMFLNRVAGNVLYILNDEQKQVFLSLAQKQSSQLEELAKKRLPLIKAFFLQRDNKIPSGSLGLNKRAVIRYVGDIFAFDAELSYYRAEAMAKVALSLTPEQKIYLGQMKFGDFNTWPDIDERDKIKVDGRGKSKMFNVAYMTYASEFFSWTAGSVEADTYFCPERHGTYFGGFYMKDMPAMGKRDYDISTSVTGDSGKTFLNDVLTVEQRKYIEEILDFQKEAITEMITVRRSISTELRKFLVGQMPDKEKVIALGKRYGELDGEVSWYYTMAFSRIHHTLTAEQCAQLIKLRNLEGYESSTYYIYSQPVQGKLDLENVNAFF